MDTVHSLIATSPCSLLQDIMALWLLTILLLRSTPGLRAEPMEANPGNIQRIPLPKMRFMGRDFLEATAAVSGQPANSPEMLRAVEDPTPAQSDPDSMGPTSSDTPQLQGKYDMPSLPLTIKGQGQSGGGIANPMLVPTVGGMPGPTSAPAPTHAQAPPLAKSSFGIARPLSSISLSSGDMAWEGQPLTSPLLSDMSAPPAKPADTLSRADVHGDTSAPELIAKIGMAPAPGGVNDGGVAQTMNEPKYIIVPACANVSLGVHADPTDPRCWYNCLGLGELGCRFCCAWNACYKPPQPFFPLGSCQSCAPRPPSPPPLPPPKYALCQHILSRIKHVHTLTHEAILVQSLTTLLYSRCWRHFYTKSDFLMGCAWYLEAHDTGTILRF